MLLEIHVGQDHVVTMRAARCVGGMEAICTRPIFERSRCCRLRDRHDITQRMRHRRGSREGAERPKKSLAPNDVAKDTFVRA